MKTRRFAVAGLGLFFASFASADITPVAEFSGDVFEGFENVAKPGGYPGPVTILDGNATMDDTLAHFVVIAFVWQGPGGTLEPFNGNLFGGTVVGSTIFQFSTPITQFGGHFGTVGSQPGGTAVFRDAAGETIGSVTVEIGVTTWGWQGWHSDTPISSIELIGVNVPGVSTQYDDLQITFESSTPCTGDLDGDDQVGLSDLATLLSNFGTPSGATPEQGDLDGNGSVELSDLALLLANFGTTCE